MIVLIVCLPNQAFECRLINYKYWDNFYVCHCNLTIFPPLSQALLAPSQD